MLGGNYKNLNYLIVEDNKVIAAHLQKLFSSKKLTFKVVENCDDAFKNAYYNSYDLILCDLILPDGNGKDLIEKIGNNADCKSQLSKIAILTGDKNYLPTMK